MRFLRIIFLLCFMFKVNAFAQFSSTVKISKEVIFKSITSLNRALGSKKAWHYAGIIDKYSRLYQVDPLLVVSIAKLEGNFILNSIGGYYSKDYTEEGDLVRKYNTTDYCMMQIHKSNVTRLKLSSKKLLKDPDYCIQTGVRILASLKPYQRYESSWWTRYNSATPKFRRMYQRQVLHFYREIEKFV